MQLLAACGCNSAAAASKQPAQLVPSTAGQQHQQSHRRNRRQRHVCQAVEPLAIIANTDPSALQDLIVGGAVTAAVGAALYSGLKKEPTPCDLCAGNGGIRCFACQGGGSMDLIDKDLLLTTEQRPPKRDIIGRSGANPRACKVCKGTGLVLCSKCKGSGYLTKF